MEDEISADALKSIKYILKNSPTGETQDVLEHITTLVGNEQLVFNNPALLQTLRKFYE